MLKLVSFTFLNLRATMQNINFIEHMLSQLTNENEQAQFKYFYHKQSKSIFVAYLLLIFFGWFGLHKFYLDKKTGWLYFLFCWTGIPLLFVVLDFFTLPFQVSKYNQELALALVRLIKSFGSGHQGLISLEQAIMKRKTKNSEWLAVISIVALILLPFVIYSYLRLSHHKAEFHYKSINPDGSQQYDRVVNF